LKDILKCSNECGNKNVQRIKEKLFNALESGLVGGFLGW
jgi:hypothetical protein